MGISGYSDATFDDPIIWRIDNLRNGANKSMDVNGATTPQDFSFAPQSGEVYYLESLSFYLLDAGSPDPNDFGNIDGGLTNGLQIIARIGGVEYEIGNITDNMQVVGFFSDNVVLQEGLADFLNNDDMFLGNKNFRQPIRLNGDTNDALIFRVRDNLNGLDELEVVAHAWRPL